MAPNPRVVRAFRAMKELGISDEKVRPVLKNLLKLYEKKWDLIEAENYRALADAIFEAEDAKVSDQKKCNPADEEEEHEEDDSVPLERPLKRIRRGQQGQSSSYPSNCETGFDGSLKEVKEEQGEPSSIPSPHELHDILQSPQSNRINVGTNGLPTLPVPNLPRSVSPSYHGTATDVKDLLSQRHLGDKGKEPMSSTVSLGEKEVDPVRTSNALCIRDPESDPRIFLEKSVADASIISKEDPYLDNIPQYEAPIAVIHPDASSVEDDLGITVANGISDLQEALVPLQVDKHMCGGIPALSRVGETYSEFGTIADEIAPSLELASSSSGEVKISLSCNSSLGTPNCHVPSVDELIESMEKKCLKSYKIIDPNFSVKKLMQDMCECFLELGTNSSNELQERLSSVMPALDVMKESAEKTGLGVGVNSEHSCVPPLSSNGSVDVHYSANGDSNSDVGKGLVVIPQNHLDELRWLHNVNDISKGEEKIEIPWVNDIGKDHPPNFQYVSQNLVFQNARVNISLSRIDDGSSCSTCINNCLASPTSCACAFQAGGEFAYTLDGVLKEDFLEECISITRDPQKQSLLNCRGDCPIEKSKKDNILEPCKGHLKRKIIKECWTKCGCHKICGNRLVQRGVNYKLQVFLTPDGKGWGLRTLEKLPKGAFVCEFVGEVLTVSEFYSRRTEKHTSPVLLDAYWGLNRVMEEEEALCLDGTCYGNAARFINHRCWDANLIEVPVEVETPEHHYYHLAFFTTREVDALEELTWDYGIDFDEEDQLVKAFRCKCGSKYCRNMKRPTRSKIIAG